MKRRIVLGISSLAALVFVVGGSACTAATDEEDPVGEVQSEVVDPTKDGCGHECSPDNCVGYARCRTAHDAVPGTLPYGLTTFAEKRAIARYEQGHRGCVAMIPTSRVYGHAAYVEDVNVVGGVRHYRISEASWQFEHQCDARTGTKAALNIAEFWCPN